MKIQDINEAPDRLYNIQQMLYKTLEEYSTPDCPLYGNLYAYHASDVAGSDLNRLYLVMGRDPQCAGPDWPKGLDPVAAIRSQERDPLLFHTNVKVIDLTHVEDELNLSGIIVNWAATTAALHRIYDKLGGHCPLPDVIQTSEITYLKEREQAIWNDSVNPEAKQALRKQLGKFFRAERTGGKWLDFYRSDRYPRDSNSKLKAVYYYLRYYGKPGPVPMELLMETAGKVHETPMAEREYKLFAAAVKQQHPELTYAVSKAIVRDEGLDKKEGETFAGVKRVSDDEYQAIKDAKFASQGWNSLAGLQPAKWVTRSVFCKESDAALVESLYQQIHCKFAKGDSLQDMKAFGPLETYDILASDFDNFVSLAHANMLPFYVDTEGKVKTPTPAHINVVTAQCHRPKTLGVLERIVNANITLAHDEPWFTKDGSIAEIYDGRKPFELVRFDRSEAASQVNETQVPSIDDQIQSARERTAALDAPQQQRPRTNQKGRD